MTGDDVTDANVMHCNASCATDLSLQNSVVNASRDIA